MSHRRKTLQTTIMIFNDEIPESDVHASLLSFLFLIGFFLRNFFLLLAVTLLKTVRLEARDFCRVIVERLVHNSENK